MRMPCRHSVLVLAEDHILFFDPYHTTTGVIPVARYRTERQPRRRCENERGLCRFYSAYDTLIDAKLPVK